MNVNLIHEIASSIIMSIPKLSSDYSRILERLAKTKTFAISSNFYISLVAAEDHRYWQHCGIDVISIIRALYRTVLCRKIEGASTIEQQLIRTLTFRYEISIQRKLREVLLALAVGKLFKKEQIILFYLLLGNYGWKMNGLVDACNELHVCIETASLVDAANVVARLKRPEPSVFSQSHTKAVAIRSIYILGRVDKHYQPIWRSPYIAQPRVHHYPTPFPHPPATVLR